MNTIFCQINTGSFNINLKRKNIYIELCLLNYLKKSKVCKQKLPDQFYALKIEGRLTFCYV